MLHGWKSTEQKIRGIWKWERTITCFGDRTSRAFLMIASVSRTKITWSQGPITLSMWMLSTVLNLLVYSLTVAISLLTMPVGFNFNLTFGFKTSSRWHQNCHCLETIHFPSWVAHSHIDYSLSSSLFCFRIQWNLLSEKLCLTNLCLQSYVA